MEASWRCVERICQVCSVWSFRPATRRRQLWRGVLSSCARLQPSGPNSCGDSDGSPCHSEATVEPIVQTMGRRVRHRATPALCHERSMATHLACDGLRLGAVVAFRGHEFLPALQGATKDLECNEQRRRVGVPARAQCRLLELLPLASHTNTPVQPCISPPPPGTAAGHPTWVTPRGVGSGSRSTHVTRQAFVRDAT